MYNSFKLFDLGLIFLCIECVFSDPATLQRLYDTPAVGTAPVLHNSLGGSQFDVESANINSQGNLGNNIHTETGFSSHAGIDHSNTFQNPIGSIADIISQSNGEGNTDEGHSSEVNLKNSILINELSGHNDHSHAVSGDGNVHQHQEDLVRLELGQVTGTPSYGDITITEEFTHDIFTTLTNVFYNTIPVTLTQFVKTTRVVPTVQVDRTPVDDKVMVSTAPVTRTDTVFVTDTNTAHQYVTEISTDLYTITHRAYDIRQQVVTSKLIETQVIRPTIVSTVILTEFETSTEFQTVTNTLVVQSTSSLSFPTGPSGVGSPAFDLRSDLTLARDMEVKHDSLSQRQNELIQRLHHMPNQANFISLLLKEKDLLVRSRDLPARKRLSFQEEFLSLLNTHILAADAIERTLGSSFTNSPTDGGHHGYY